MNENAILKSCSKDLNNESIVKSAGAVQNIKNWLKRLFSSEYREKAQELAARSENVQSLLQDLSDSINKVQGAIKDANIKDYEEYLNEVKILTQYLITELTKVEESATEASVISEDVAPQKEPESKIELPEPLESPESLEFTDAPSHDPSHDPSHSEKHAPGYDVPMGSVNKPFSSFNHFKDISKDNIFISENSKNNVLRRNINKLRKANFPADELVNNSSKKAEFFEKIKEAIISGTIIDNQYTSAAKEPLIQQKEGLTRIVVENNVSVLNLNFKVIAILTDFSSAADNPVKKLSLFRLNIYNIEYDKKSEVRQKVIFLSVPNYADNEESKKDIANEVTRLKKEKGVDKVQDVPSDKVDLIRKYYEDEGYDVVEVVDYKTLKKAQASVRRRFLMKIAQEKNVHAWAREILLKAFKKVVGRDPTLAEIQLAQSVALGESGYGRGWHKSKSRSTGPWPPMNWGAIQTGRKPDENGQCPVGSFDYGDTSPDTGAYRMCFKAYPSHEAGAEDLIRVLFLSKRKGNYAVSRAEGNLQAAQNQSITEFSTAMYDTGYYEGFGPNREARINWHKKYMVDKLNSITKALNEPIAFTDHPKSTAKKPDISSSEQDQLKQLEQFLWSAAKENTFSSIVKKALANKVLPKSKFLISANDINDEQLGKIKNLLNTIDAEVKVNKKGNIVKLECFVPGKGEEIKKAVNAICNYASESFRIVDNKSVKISCKVGGIL